MSPVGTAQMLSLDETWFNWISWGLLACFSKWQISQALPLTVGSWK